MMPQSKAINNLNNIREITQVVIVTYNPDIPRLKENLHALSRQFKNILIVDNASNNCSSISALVSKFHFKVSIIRLEENKGIAAAQNIALDQLVNNKRITWLLTLDQDSIIPENLTAEYTKTISSYESLGLIGCSFTDRQNKIIETPRIISSGSLINIAKLRVIGGFNEDLFISHVDHECCLRMKRFGYKTLLNKNVVLDHNLGTQTNRKTFLGTKYTFYDPIRYYYNTRSAVFIFRNFFWVDPLFVSEILLYGSFLSNCFLLVHEPNKIVNLKLIFQAFFDGLLNRFNKYA